MSQSPPTKTLDFIFDFGSPNAYLSWKVLPGVLARTGAELNLIPCLLGGLWPMSGARPSGSSPSTA
jgi:2-hydroxychromene-2-carboxylate isomerase